MKGKSIKTAIYKMQRNAIDIDEELATYVDGFTGLWIPPAEGTEVFRWVPAHYSDIRVGEACRILSIPHLGRGKRDNVQALWYPITDQLNIDLCKIKDPDIPTEGSEGFQRSLISKGWKFKSAQGADQKRLVREFLNLSNAPLKDLGDLVRTFALKWGPLWCCMAHSDCSWAPTSYGTHSLAYKCSWFCSEPLILFQAKARQAEAAITIAGYLAEEKHAPMEHWHTLTSGIGLGVTAHYEDGSIGTLAGRTKYDLWFQQRQLMEEVNRFIVGSNGPTFRMYWSNRKRKPVMYFDMGLGFIRLVWLQIAQSLCGGKGIYKCDSCPNYYMPRRKPPEGRHHFCPACGGPRKLGSKRLSARTRRKNKAISI